MDIRIINKNNEIMNISQLSIMTMDNYIVGMNDKMEIIKIEKYGDKEEAKDRLIALGNAIEIASEKDLKAIIIRT